MPLSIRGAAEHNLRHVDLDLPKDKLIVFCGPSGSGKTSLAFDTLHAESQRRFVEALSAAAREKLGQAPKPAFDLMTGLSPSIGLAQRGAVSPSPRATVGTVTDLHDLLRVLFARAGTQHCPTCGRAVSPVPQDRVIAELLAVPEGTALTLCAPIARRRVGGVKPLLDELGRQGFSRIRLDGATVRLDEAPAVDARVPHDVDVVVDRIRAGADKKDRLQDSVGTALKLGRGAVLVEVGGELRAWSTRPHCPVCDRDFPELEPRVFSFDSPAGACPGCQGLGLLRTIDEARLVDPDRTLAEGAVSTWKGAQKLLEEAARRRGIALDVPWNELPWEARDVLLHGDDELDGAVKTAAKRPNAPWVEEVCTACGGSRLAEAPRHVRIGTHTLPALTARTLAELLDVLPELPRTPVTTPLLDEVERRTGFLVRVGLHYVTLDRAAATLSGGELQRLRLGAQVGHQLSGVLYVLDEPTAGLHPSDTAALLGVLRELRDLGNTVLVVEHDALVLAAADLVVEFGPGAGPEGGQVLYVGPPSGMAETPTGRWLREGLPTHARPRERGAVTVVGARGHNLACTVRFPLGQLVGVTGVSGAGKSSLVEDTLAVALAGGRPLPCDRVEGTVRRVVRVDQAPIGRSARSTVATATKLWDPVRELLAKTPEAKARGFTAAQFSTNQAGGRCPACEGEGVRRIEMQLLADVVVPCDVCGGRRFDEATLAVHWKGVNAGELLAMTVREARRLFPAIPTIAGPLEVLDALGLGYLPLGQAGDTWSGGEAQRIKLAQQLGRPGEVDGTLYVLDEPTIGLHPVDVAALVEALRRLVTLGGSIVVVEHDPAFLDACDWLVELGPGAGAAGGRLVAEGPPEALAANPASPTGRWLRPAAGRGATRA